MVSKNNQWQHLQVSAQRVPHYGLRKLSVGVASVLLSTTLYMGVSAHADTVTTPSGTNAPATTATTSSPTPTETTGGAAGSSNSGAPSNSVSETPISQGTPEKSAAGSGSVDPSNGTPIQPAETAAPTAKPAAGDETPKVAETVNHATQNETVDSQWIIHYVNQSDHKQELKDPTVITLQYTRTNTSQSDGTTKYGDWSYVPGSFKQTGTPITVNDGDNPVKQDNIDKDGENMDSFTITAMYPTIAGYTMYNNINGTRLHDYLRNNDRQADTMSKDFYAEYDVAKERSVSVKFVDDQSFDPNVSGGKAQVGQATTLTGRDGDTVKVNVTVPDKYQLADGQQLPTTYTFAKGSGDLKIHLVHQVVQREATINFQLGLVTFVDFGDNSYEPAVLTQARWKQLEEEAKDGDGPVLPDGEIPFTEVGTLTGHVGYDLVDEEAVSFGDDWTSLNLGSRTYQLPNGTDVVNGILIDSDDTMGEKLKEYYLNEYQNWDSNKHVDPDYANRPWHGYLSVNATNNTQTPGADDIIRSGLQAGLAGDESNTLAKATGDRAATAVEMVNKTIDVSWLQDYLNFTARDFKEQDGQLKAKTGWEAFGVYIPYVEKTATRTINVTTPDGKTTSVKQTATLAKQVDFSKNAHPAWTTDEWTSYEVPVIPGYTASQSQVAKEAVTGTMKDQTVNITYTANAQATHVNYVDAQGKLIHATTINGKTGQTVKVSSEIPDGWKLVDGQTVPNTITFGPDGHADMSVKIEHRHVTVTPDKPQANGTELPDNSKQSFHGVEASDLNKTVTRTIKVTTPTGKTNTIKQEAKLARTATVDEVTGDVNYGDWSIGKWDAYQVPSLNGYTATQPEVVATSVNENTKDQTVDVSYTPNKQSTVVKYVDDKGQVVYTTTVNGATDQTVKVPSEVPAGWMITKGEVPNEITFGADGHEAIEVTVGHRHVTVDPAHPQTNGTKLPDNPAKIFDGVEANDLNKTITRTIKVTTPDGQTKTVTQTAKLTRNADVDEVTGEVTYGKWTTGKWSAYNVPAVLGYTASQTSVVATPVDGNTKDQTIDVHYTANSQTTHINYVDNTGTIVYTTTVTGKTGETVKVPNEVPVGWMVTKGEVPSEISFGSNGHTDDTITIGHQHITVDQDHPQNNGTKLPDNPAKTFEGVEANDLNKTITRTIKVTTPDGKSTTTKQIAKLTRTADVDEVTGEVTYGKWTTGEWAAYNVPSVAGYAPSQTVVSKESVTAASKDTMVEITYSPMQHQISVEYVDDDDHGKIVKTDQVPGETDQTITVTPSAPANYDLVDNGNCTYTVTSDDVQSVQIHVKHHQVTTSESKTVTRTINVHTPHDGVKAIKQTVELTRDVTTDQTTGEKTYGDWSATLWDHYAVPAVAGYVPSIKQVAQQVVNGTTTDQTIDVTYSSGEHTTHINYVDGDGKIVHTTTIKGQTDGTAQVPNETPAGWTVVGEPVPTELAFGPDGHADVTVMVAHQHVTVTPDQPKTSTDKLPDNPAKTYPNGVGHDDLNEIVTRTVKVTIPDGQTKTVTQTAKLTRTADVDEVTGKVTYGKWTTGKWSSYEIPAVPGYTASQNEVPAVNVTDDTNDQTVTVTYTANDQTTHINYVDGNGKIVHTTTVTGKTDQTVKVPNEVPAGWTITGGQVPSEVTFGANGHSDITVTVDHRHVTVTPDRPQPDGAPLPDNPSQHFTGVESGDLNKTITRTIVFNVPGQDPRTITQTAKLTRTATVDEVTGAVTYGDWTTAQWPAVTVPAVDDYTTSQTQISAVTVGPKTDNQTVTVDYQAVEVPTAKPEARSTMTSHTSGTKPMEMPTTHARVVSPTVSATPVASAAKTSQLPQTGTDKVVSTIMTSLGLLMGALSAYVFGRKQKGKGRKS